MVNDDDREFWRQLSWLYPMDYVTELRRLVEEAASQYINQAQQPSVRELVAGLIEKANKESSGETDVGSARDEAEAALIAKEAADKVLTALREGKPHIPAGMGPEVLVPLLTALESAEVKVSSNALSALCQLTDGGTIDRLCELWANTRRADIEEIILKSGYLASRPLGLRLLTVLKNKADRIMIDDGWALVPELLSIIDDTDRIIAGRARRLLLTLTNRGAIDAVCEAVLAEPENNRLRIWASLAGYCPSNASRAAFYYAATGQWSKYYKLDWQNTRPLLAQGYQQAVVSERRTFLEMARKSGQSLLIAELLLEQGSPAEYEEIKGEDWAAIVDSLTSEKNWPKLYDLRYLIPAEWAAEAILRLIKTDWRPENKVAWNDMTANCPQVGKDCFVPDGRSVVCLSTDNPTITIECAAFHPNGRSVVGGGSDGRLRVWHIASGELTRTVDLHADTITAVAFTADGRYIVTAGREGKVHSWRFPEIKWVSSVSGQPGLVKTINAHTPEQIVAAANAAGASAARVWNWDGTSMANWGQYPAALLQSAAVDLEHKLTAGGLDGKIRLYRLRGSKGGSSVWPAHEGMIRSIATDSDGRFVVSTGVDGQLKLWGTGGKLLLSMPEEEEVLAISRSCNLAAVGRSNKRKLLIRQVRLAKPLAWAELGDLEHVGKLITWQGLSSETRGAVQFVHKLLTAKLGTG